MLLHVITQKTKRKKSYFTLSPNEVPTTNVVYAIIEGELSAIDPADLILPRGPIPGHRMDVAVD